SPQPIQKIAPGMKAVIFPLVIDAKAKVGNHKTLNLQARVKVDGEVIVQTNGTGQLRIDKPLPPKADAPPKKPAVEKPKQAPKDKPLSRLEQLRQKKSS
ncbi:MAG: serine protease, partial [Planctomycetota bacterium]